MNISGFADALRDCHLAKPVPRQSGRSPAPPEPLTFVVHRTNGRLWPALYHGEWKIGCYDPIVREWPLDTLPNGAELCARPPDELLDELWSWFQALETLGALPERVGPPTPRGAA